MQRRTIAAIVVAVVLLLLVAAYPFRFLVLSRFHVGGASDGAPLGLRRVRDVDLPARADRLDYQAIDKARRLLWIAHLGSDEVVPFDLANGTLRPSITGISSPHGIVVDPERGRVYVSATGTHDVVAVDETTGAIVAEGPAGTFPDGLAVDGATGNVFVSDESGGTVIVLDGSDLHEHSRIELGGEAGNSHADPVTHTIVSAAQGKDELVIIDPSTETVARHIPVPGCRGPHGFDLDPSQQLAFVTCEANARLVVMDLADGSSLGSFSVGKVPDVVSFDWAIGRLYVASESGVVSAFQLTGRTLTKTGETYLAPAAHTIIADPVTHRVYVPLEDIDGRPVLRIFERR